MGVKDLLNFVKDSLRPNANLAEFRGKTVAVDVSCWLHRGVFSCVEEIAMGQPTKKYLNYTRKMLVLLARLDLHVILVFDGQRLPAKAQTNATRKERRDGNRELGLRLLKEGKVQEARSALIQTTQVSHDMVRELIKTVRGKPGVDVLMSPFESDAQLTHLQNVGIADLIITEDSDLIPFGCKKIMFKMDENGNGTLFDSSQLYKCLVSDPAKFDFVKFRRVCILAGCDYLPEGLPGVGLTKARTFFAKVSNPDLRRTLRRIPLYLNMKKLVVPAAFVDAFIEADNTFCHQIVFDPASRTQIPLQPYPEPKPAELMINQFEEGENPLSASDFPYAGVPCTTQGQDKWSIWSSDYEPKRPYRSPVKQRPAPSSFEIPRTTEPVRTKSLAAAFPRRSPRKSLALVPSTPENELMAIYGCHVGKCPVAQSQPVEATETKDEEVPPPKRRRISQYFKTITEDVDENPMPMSKSSRTAFRRPRFSLPSPATSSSKGSPEDLTDSSQSSPTSLTPPLLESGSSYGSKASISEEAEIVTLSP